MFKLHCLILPILFAWIGYDATSALGAADKVAVALVPDNFVAAVVIQPQKIAKSPTVADLPLNSLWKLLQDQTKVDPLKLDQAIVYIEPFPGGNVLFFPAVVVRFADEVDGAKLFADSLEKTEKKKVGKGKEYVNSTTQKLAKVPISGYQIDKKSFLFAPEPTMIKMLSTGSGKGPLSERLKNFESDAAIAVIITPEPIRKEINQIVKENAGEIPERWTPAKMLPDAVDLIAVKIDLDDATMIQIVIETKNVKSAMLLKGLIRDGIVAAEPLSNELLKGMLSDASPKVREFIKPLVDEIQKNTAIEQDDKNVIVRVSRPKPFAPSKKK